MIHTFLLVAFSSLCYRGVCQNTLDDPIAGTWKGTSICQVKNSPCHEEIAVYHAITIPGQKSYNFQMNKMINGKEEEMRPLVFIYDEESMTLTAVNEASNEAKGRSL